MSFPTPTANGELYTTNGYTYQWFADQYIWKIVSKSSTISNATINNATINVSSFSGTATFNANVFVNSSVITVGNTSVNVSINSTTFSGTSNNSSYLGGNSVSTILAYANNKAANAYSNAISYADLSAANAYSNAIAYSGNAAQAYSNATTYADNKAADAYSNAVTYAGNKADNAYSNAISYTNTNIALKTGTTFTGTVTHTANIVANGAIIAGGNSGLAGQFLTSNGNGNVYWTSITASINTGNLSAQSIFVTSGNISVGNSTNNTDMSNTGIFISNSTTSTTLNLSTFALGNTTVNVTINSTTFSGTANNASYLNGNSASTLRTYSDTKAATAYSNAATYADGKASTAYTNAIAYTNTSIALKTGATFSGDVTFNANIVANTIVANGYLGTNGQVLTTNSTGGVYWSAGVGNLSAEAIAISVGNLSIGNSTVNTDISNTGVFISNTTSTVTLNIATFAIGNSTVNTTANSNSIKTTNVTVKTVIANGALGTNGQVLTTNSTGGVYWGTGSANLLVDAITISAGNLSIGNTIANTDVSNNGVFIQNSSSSTTLNLSGLNTGNSTVNSTTNTSGMSATGAGYTTSFNTAGLNISISAGGSIAFNGSNSYITGTVTHSPGTSTGAAGIGDFTMEAWIRASSLAGSGDTPGVISLMNGDGTNTGFWLYVNNARWGVRNNAGDIITYYNPPAINNFYHVALVRNSGTLTLYINGTSVATTSTNYTFSDTTFIAGSMNSTYFNGYISNIRYTWSVPVYTSNFTPSILPLSTIAYTELLLLQTTADTYLTDTNSNYTPITITASGTPSYSSLSPFTISNYTSANTAGVFTSGSVNAATHSVGTKFVANNSRVTISGIPLNANGSNGTAGQILTSNGSTGSPYWSPAVDIASYALKAGTTFTGNVVFNANIVANTLVANGSLGTNGQILTTNSTGGVYWSTGVGNLAASAMTISVGNLSIGNSTVNTDMSNVGIFISNSTSTTTVNLSTIAIGNSTVNTTINSNSLATTNVSVSKLIANGAAGTNGQILTTNSTGGVYWGTGVGNLAADAMTISVGNLSIGNTTNNTDISNTGIFISNTLTSTTLNLSSLSIGNTVNTVVNSSIFRMSNGSSHEYSFMMLPDTNAGPLFTIGFDNRVGQGPGGSTAYFPQGGGFGVSWNVFIVNTSFMQLGNTTNYMNLSVNNNPSIKFVIPDSAGGGFTANELGFYAGNTTSNVVANTTGFYINGASPPITASNVKTNNLYANHSIVNNDITVGGLASTTNVTVNNQSVYITNGTTALDIFIAQNPGGSTGVGPFFGLGFNDHMGNGGGGGTAYFPQGSSFALGSNIFSVNTSFIQLGNSSNYMNFSIGANSPYITAVNPSDQGGGFTANDSGFYAGNGTVYISANTNGFYVNSGSFTGSELKIGNSTVNTTINSTAFNTTSTKFTGNVTIDKNLTVTGNLILAGTTTFVNSTVITTNDLNIIFANSAANSMLTDGAGIVAGTSANLVFDDPTTSWQSNVNITPSTNSLNLGAATRIWSNAYIRNIIANGSIGTSAQVLTSNSTGGAYWTSMSTAADLSADSIAVTVGNLSIGNTTVNTDISNNGVFISNTTASVTLDVSGLTIGNSTVNSVVNSTAFSGTANNSLYLNGLNPNAYVSNSYLTQSMYVQTGSETFANVFSLSGTSNVRVTIANTVTSVGNSYCLEFWVRFATTNSSATNITTGGVSSLQIAIANNGATISESGYTTEFPGGFNVAANTWHHYAYIGTGNYTYFYVDGVRATWYTSNSYATPTATPTHGGKGGQGGYTQNGILALSPLSLSSGYAVGAGAFDIIDFRITTGNTVYALSGFTPPTSHLTSITGTQVLLFTSNTFTDAGPYSLSVTNNGGTVTPTVVGPLPSANVALRLTSNVKINTGIAIYDSTDSQGTAGQVLTSNGAANVYWSSASTDALTLGGNTAQQLIDRSSNAYSNAVTYAGNKADNAYSNAISYTNTNIALKTGTTFTGNVQTNATLAINGAIALTGSNGTLGYFLTSNGDTGAPYWTSPAAAVVNVDATYAWTNIHTFAANVTVNSEIKITGGTAATTGTGTLAFANNLLSMGNNTVNSTLSPTTLTMGGGSLTTTGTGGLTANLTTIFVGNNTSNALINTTGFYVGGTQLINTNVAAQYAWTNTQSFSNTISFGNATVNAIISTNSSVTSFSGTSNNSIYLNGALSNAYVSNAYLTNVLTVNTTSLTLANVFSFTGTANLTAGFSNTVSSVGNSYCLEFWVNFPTTNTTPTSVLLAPSPDGLVFQIANNGAYIGNYAYVTEYAGGFSIAANTWHHIAYIGTGSQTYLFVDGSPATWYTSSTFITPTATPTHGGKGGSGGATQNGTLNTGGLKFYSTTSGAGSYKIIDFRVTTSNTVYSLSGFTPPTTHLTAITGTQILLFTSNVFTDAGLYSIVTTNNGGVLNAGTYGPLPSTNTALSLNANVKINPGISVYDSTGSQGTAGQVLTSNGTANVYWSTIATDSSTLNGNTAQQLIDRSSNAYSNAIAYSGNAALAYANAVTYADNKAANAYSNAVTYAGNKADNAYSNAIAYSGNAALAYANAIAYSGNAALAYANAIAYSGNAAQAYANAIAYTNTNIALLNASQTFSNTTTFSNTITFGSATVNAAISTNSTVTSFSGTSNNSLYFGGYGLSTFVTNTYLSTALTNVVNTTANFTYNGTQSYSNTVTFSNLALHTANLTVNAAVIAGGNSGTAGQYLTSNGTSNVYWSSPGAASVNVAAQYAFTNTISFSNTTTHNGILGANSVVQLNGSNGTAGQVLTSNGSSNAYWSTATGGGSVNLASSYAFTNTTASVNSNSGAITTLGGIGANGNIYTAARVGFANSTGANQAYTYYNATTGSLDTVFG